DVEGPAQVLFQEPVLRRLESRSVDARALNKVEKQRLYTLAQLIGYVRFFHPSDQVAEMPWAEYESEGVDRTIHAVDDETAVGVCAPSRESRDDRYPVEARPKRAERTRY